MKEGDLAVAVQAGATSGGEPPLAVTVPEDQRTPARAASDRRAMVAELMEVHGDAVFGFCLRVVRARTIAEDVVQQVFMEAYRDLDRFEGRSSPRTWLFGIASHRCLDALKTQERRLTLIENDEQTMLDFEDPGMGPIEHVEHARLTAALEGCLKRLSPEVRATVLMRFQTGCTYEELAAPLASTADTLQVRVARALQILRRCLEKKGWNGE